MQPSPSPSPLPQPPPSSPPGRPPHLALRIVTGVLGVATIAGIALLAFVFVFVGAMGSDSCGATHRCNTDLAGAVLVGGIGVFGALALAVLIANLIYVIRPRRATWVQIVVLVAGVVVPLLAFAGGFALLAQAYGA